MPNHPTLPDRGNPSITYAGMIWLLAAQLVVMLPFVLHLPVWLLAVVFFTAGWRLRVLSGQAAQPGNLIKGSLLLLGMGGLLLSGLRFPSLEAMSALLLLGFAFKSLEAVQRRDAWVVIFTGYFLVALHFLYTQSMLAGLYGAFALLVLTGALLGVQQQVSEFTTGQQVRFNLRLAGILLLQCLPLMILIFLFAPRLPPFWSLPLVLDQPKQGISDRMAPGDIEKLSQSDALAFRVTFSGQRPPQSQLYWHGLVLNHFDGREWRQFATEADIHQLKLAVQREYGLRPGNMKIQGTAVDYEAIYEKSGQPWLFTLAPSVQVQGEVLRAADYRVMAQQDIQSPFLLRATSYPESVRDLRLDPLVRELALQLPADTDPRSRALAYQLRTAAADELAYIQAILNRFREQAFYYTLHPPTLGESNTIDGFLFDSQRGFCAHYAGSFVFLMRAVGIPARVVVGYQGGEWNEQGHYLAVHQFDAHAWAEVWLPEQGWIRVDPTSMVAPERTERGLEAALQNEGSFLEDSLFSARKLGWLKALRQQLDWMQYGWQRWVLSYDGETQADLLKKFLGDLSPGKIALTVGGLFAVILLFWLVLLGLTRKPKKEAAEHQLYRRFTAKLAKHGIQREPGQAPGEFAKLAAQALPAQAELIHRFTQTYENLCYLPEGGNPATARQQLKRLLGRLT